MIRWLISPMSKSRVSFLSINGQNWLHLSRTMRVRRCQHRMFRILAIEAAPSTQWASKCPLFHPSLRLWMAEVLLRIPMYACESIYSRIFLCATVFFQIGPSSSQGDCCPPVLTPSSGPMQVNCSTVWQSMIVRSKIQEPVNEDSPTNALVASQVSTTCLAEACEPISKHLRRRLQYHLLEPVALLELLF